MQRNTLAALIAGLLTLPVQAESLPTLDEILVTATRIPTADVVAPFASEVHTRRSIEQSGAATLYDYLARQTSVQLLPSFGNRHTPQIDMRGFGLGGGYQNIVVTLDGRRLNNIDSMPQLLGSIPLADIERIEITKGSGSVVFGDGATAGTIQIYSRPHQGVALAAGVGNHGLLTATVTAGVHKEKASLSASADHSSLDGYSAADPSGHTDASSARTWRGSLVMRPVAKAEFSLDLASTRIDARYNSPLTLAQFRTDPAQPGSNPFVAPANAYTHQKIESDHWRLNGEVALANNVKLTASHGHEDKVSDYLLPPFPFRADYDASSDDLAVQYRGTGLDLTAGVQRFDGARIGAANRTSKDNVGWYAQGQYRLHATTLAIGARRENVEYRYAPVAGAASRADHSLNAWDIGVNQRVDGQLSLFANFNRAFQAPDIDRFFNFGGAFNGFITPAISRTFNLGLNHVTPNNRLKFTVFRANLDHEIYFNPLTFTNTNLDQTRKYGLELQDTWRPLETLTANLNYTWTRALIDQENDGGGTFNHKALPGVPRHGLVLGLAWQASPAASLGLTHTWRSNAYAAEDFANTFNQKQGAFQSTDLSFSYQMKKMAWFAGVENLFERSNGFWVRDDAIYPVSFTRNWRLGMKAVF